MQRPWGESMLGVFNSKGVGVEWGGGNNNWKCGLGRNGRPDHIRAYRLLWRLDFTLREIEGQLCWEVMWSEVSKDHPGCYVENRLREVQVPGVQLTRWPTGLDNSTTTLTRDPWHQFAFYTILPWSRRKVSWCQFLLSKWAKKADLVFFTITISTVDSFDPWRESRLVPSHKMWAMSVSARWFCWEKPLLLVIYIYCFSVIEGTSGIGFSLTGSLW